MNRSWSLALALFLLLPCCAAPQTDTVFQVSTIDALLAGVYDGEMDCRGLLRRGDFGIGTFDRLDGEMVLLDGRLYQVKADGRVYAPDLSLRTPFATVCRFEADQAVAVDPGSDFDAVEGFLDQCAPNQNLFYAIRIEGRFRSMRTRSVPAQQKPYPPLKEATRQF